VQKQNENLKFSTKSTEKPCIVAMQKLTIAKFLHHFYLYEND